MAPSKPKILAAALVAAGLHAHAQQSPSLAPVTITGRHSPAADITPFGDVPLQEVPASVSIISRQQIEDAGARRLADLTRFDASIADAYNAPGYWDFLSIRGFTLDNRFNYRREGLPISAETVIPLDNKERIEVLKGTSGIQAGTSAPGGLVNYAVKRPTTTDWRQVKLEVTQRASVLAAADLGGRAGAGQAFGYRLNVAHERMRPEIRNADGERSLLAFAGDWRIGRDSLLEGELEWSRQAQPSQVGFSLLGPVLPGPVDPRLNLNNQPWVKTTQFDAVTGTLRFTQPLGDDWRWSARLGSQRLETDDYTAFPFGCGAELAFDRYCSDGTFDYYDFRSENERRRQDAATVELKGKLRTAGIEHEVAAGLLASRVRNRYQPQAFNWVGTGNVDGTAVVPEDPTQAFAVANRDERSLELSMHAATRWSRAFSSWVGLRHTRLDRGYDQSVTTPWLALSYMLGDAVAYASWGQGVESHQVTTNPVYALANAGQVLPAAKSRQWEAGLKGTGAALAWQVAAFRITRPVTNFDFCTRTFSCSAGDYDGQAVHQGIEANGQWSHGPWSLAGGLTLLDAVREGSVAEPANNGKRPVNVPGHVLRATAVYRVPGMPLEVEGHLSHEGSRPVLADGSLSLPSWTRFDTALRYKRRMGAMETSWTLGVANLFDRRYWRESPYQFGHVYLYPGAPRTLRVAFTATL
ncbi:MAG: TonB-dependent siderophore receptor [Burkholderiales bacterium]|nr:TonB-dependent siderophore receptor [Burkholderiales bacterium]